MHFEQELIYKYSPLFLGSIIVTATVLFSLTGLLVVRRLIHHERLKLHNDVAGFMFSTLGVIYAVLLAFTVIVVWENFDKATSDVQLEANSLADLYRNAEGMQFPFSNEVGILLREYGKAIVNDEWKTQEFGEKSAKVQALQDKIWRLYITYEPKTETDRIFFEESVKVLNDLCKYRRLRLMEAKEGISDILWFVLIVCGIITIVFTFFFGTENLNAQIIMTLLLAITIALILFTILEFDYPFTGNLSVSPEPFKNLRLMHGIVWK